VLSRIKSTNSGRSPVAWGTDAEGVREAIPDGFANAFFGGVVVGIGCGVNGRVLKRTSNIKSLQK